MAVKGDLFLKNDAVASLYDKTKDYGETVKEALYSQYKTAYKISVSNYFRGDAADTFKSYVTNGTINIISGLMDISSDLTLIIQIGSKAFLEYESNQSGRVEEATLDYINKTLKEKKTTFNDSKQTLNDVLQRASQYITTQPLALGDVNTAYADVRAGVKAIRDDLYAVDDDLLKATEEVLTRIKEVKTLIQKTKAFCYNDDGTINADNLSQLQSQDWFRAAGNVTLQMMLQEDPFGYAAGEVTVSEDQWAIGLCSDVYAYAGYSFLSASGEMGLENGTLFMKGKASVLSANAYAQFTDYLRGEARVRGLYASGEQKAGWSDKYKGYRMSAEVGVAKVDGSLALGTDAANAYVKGEASVLTADAKTAFEFEENGQFAVGTKASASAASASVTGGFSVLSFKEKITDNASKETMVDRNLFGFNVGASAGYQAGFGAWMESKTAFETKYLNINATTLDVDLKLLLGVKFSVTVPTPYFKYSW